MANPSRVAAAPAQRVRIESPRRAIGDVLHGLDIERREYLLEVGDQRVALVPAWRLEAERHRAFELLAKARARGVPPDEANAIALDAVRAVRRKRRQRTV